jgi:hypothetical protein
MDGDVRFLKLATCRRWSENIVWRFMNGCDMRPALQLHPVKVHRRGRALALLRHQKRGWNTVRTTRAASEQADSPQAGEGPRSPRFGE